MEKPEEKVLRHKILSITKRTDKGIRCMAARKCTYTQPVNRFVPTSFCRHVKTFHINVYNALLLGKVEEGCGADPDGKHERMTMKTKIMSVLKVTDTDYKCGVTDYCTYKQPLDKFTPGNFARHIAALHTEVYKKLEMGKLDMEHKKAQKQANALYESASTKASRFRFMCGVVRLVTCHGLPFDCVSWQGMQDIMAPQLEVFKMALDEEQIRAFVEQTANQMQKMICEDMRGRMVSLQLHGTMGQNGQYLVRVTCSYLKDTFVCKRTLGIIVLDETKTCDDLEDRVNKIKEKCGLEQWQIYTISIDYGRIDLVQSTSDGEQEQQAEVDESRFIEILGQYNASLNDVTVLQCGRHLLSIVATEATQDFGETIEEIIEMVKSFRYEEYKMYFQTWQGRYPPIPDKNNYGFGTYLMMKALRDDRSFFEQFTTHYPGYALYLHWDLIDEFVTAFEPLYDCAVRIGNCGLSDFHLQWLLAYGRIRCIAVNQFRDKLLRAMETRQKMLEELAPYKAALYMDPRLNFRGSKLFDHNKREKIITFLQSIYTMSEDTSDDRQQTSTPSSSSTMQTSGEFSMNALLTEMLGEGSPESDMGDLIREIQLQERCDADDSEFDIIKYWLQKKMHDSRLWTLAMVVFSPLATHCDDAEEDFSQATGLVPTSGPNSSALEASSPKQDDDSNLPPGESQDHEDDAWNALFVKQNPNLLETAIMEAFFKGRQLESDPGSKSDEQV